MPETPPETPPETRLFIDADACPVKAEAERVALRHGVRMLLVSNGGIRPRPHPLIESVYVPEGLMQPTSGSRSAQARAMWW